MSQASPVAPILKAKPLTRASKVWPAESGQAWKKSRRHRDGMTIRNREQGLHLQDQEAVSVQSEIRDLQAQVDEAMRRCQAEVAYVFQDWSKRHTTLMQYFTIGKPREIGRTPPPLPEPRLPELPEGSLPEVLHPSAVPEDWTLRAQTEPALTRQQRSVSGEDEETGFLPNAELRHDFKHEARPQSGDKRSRGYSDDSTATDEQGQDNVKRASVESFEVDASFGANRERPALFRSGTSKKGAFEKHALMGNLKNQAGDTEDDEELNFGRKAFTTADDLKNQMKQNYLSGAAEHNPIELLKETGLMRTIALHPAFEYTTLAFIAINAAWMGYDTDMNTASTLLDAKLEFVIMENIFCGYFLLEWLVRFLAFKNKCLCYKDRWFVFDTALVFSMVLETWVLNLVLLATGISLEGTKALRWFRLGRLTRLARMARLLRAFPELLIMVKAIVISMKTVVYALLLLLIMVYVFSIAFTQLMEGKLQPEGTVSHDFFRSVPISMNTLLLSGALPDQAGLIDDMQAESPAYYLLMLAFLFFASLTVMNMLIGILCDVISAVSEIEKEGILISGVKEQLQQLMKEKNLGNEEHGMNRLHYEQLLLNPRAAKVFEHLGVDVFGLVDVADILFADDADKEVSFQDFMECVLELRGSNTATVKDVIELRKLISKEAQETNRKNQQLMAHAMRVQVQAAKKQESD
eukprot:TRINITY_DN6199_c0_g5_i1.p1 TRINITY_DN6199_c0_g5~~TRINITY_DN6199_c0_g5_i1.p1  ORF type:complete len:693 (+),score=161.84 TRINITY_DN6199_c0_g5_i1:95-2173(+)